MFNSKFHFPVRRSDQGHLSRTISELIIFINLFIKNDNELLKLENYLIFDVF